MLLGAEEAWGTWGDRSTLRSRADRSSEDWSVVWSARAADALALPAAARVVTSSLEPFLGLGAAEIIKPRKRGNSSVSEKSCSVPRNGDDSAELKKGDFPFRGMGDSPVWI